MSERRVLVVDDEPDARQVMSQLLRLHGIASDTVGDAQEALERLKTEPYDAAIIDIALPDMHGWQLIERIRSSSQTTNLPCIAVTAYHTSAIRFQAFEMGFNAYFPKPVEAQSFVDELCRLMSIE